MGRLRFGIQVLALSAALATACTQSAPAPPRAATTEATWVAQSGLYEVFVRDFSPEGTFAGVVAGLDRITAAGADVVWLMPIFPVGEQNRKGSLGSPYSVRDYRAVNPAFGNEADFRDLVAAAHGRGLKVILDWVPNHTSWDHVWVTEHPEFYVRDAQGGLTVPRDNDGKPTDWTDVAELDYDNPALRREMIATLEHWLQEYGIDGYRFDVAGFVPEAFWREALPALRASVDRPLLLLAEWGDLAMHRYGFDLTYAWDSYARLKAVWKGEPAGPMIDAELADMAAMPPGGMRLRFSTNHDETAWDAPPVELFGGHAGARAAFAAMAFLPGRPLLYNGQEVESPQGLPLFEREAVAWDQPGGEEARAFYRRVMDLARTDDDFLTGDFRKVATSAPDDVIAYARGATVVLVNPRSSEVEIGVTGWTADGAEELLGRTTHLGATVTLAAHGVSVLRGEARTP